MSVEPAFVINGKELSEGLSSPFLGVYLGSDYGAVASESARLVSRGSPEALYVPAVQVLLDATLGTLEQPTVNERLPSEVGYRRHIAFDCSSYVTRLAIEHDLFLHFYSSNPDLSQHLEGPNTLDSLRNYEYLESLVKAPFLDITLAAGGGLRALRESGAPMDEEPADILTRSTGLLVISGVYKGFSKEAYQALGTPYATPEHFVVSEGDNGLEVNFTEDVTKRLQALKVTGRGCPAGKIKSEGEKDSMIKQYWGRIIRYLIPADATTNTA